MLTETLLLILYTYYMQCWFMSNYRDGDRDTVHILYCTDYCVSIQGNMCKFALFKSTFITFSFVFSIMIDTCRNFHSHFCRVDPSNNKLLLFVIFIHFPDHILLFALLKLMHGVHLEVSYSTACLWNNVSFYSLLADASKLKQHFLRTPCWQYRYWTGIWLVQMIW